MAGSLIEALSPWMRYDSRESFFADSAATLTDRAGNVLLAADRRTVIAATRPTDGAAALDLDFLAGRTYLNARPVELDDVLDATGRDYVRDARRMHGEPGYANRVYGHVVDGEDGTQWLQYWFFSYYNNKSFLGFGLHEGDWEMIQIRVGADGAPDAVTFAQHMSGERRDWRDLELRDGAPIVYSALGSHASHPHKGRYPAPVVPDENDGHGPLVRLALEVVDEDYPSWASWPGRWGSTRARTPAESWSPRGPSQHPQWRDPAAFHAAARPSGEVRLSAQRAREEPAPPAPDLEVRRSDGRAVVAYRFPAPHDDQTAPAKVLLTVDDPDDALPPATYAFDVAGRAGTEEHPLAVGPGRYVVRAAGADEQGRLGPTATATLEPATAGARP